MRAVLQRVTRARVLVDGEVVGAIERGLLIYIGVAQGDGPEQAAWLAQKIADIRLFPVDVAEGARSPSGRTPRHFERSLTESGGAVLLISQFTLLADTRKGRRPSFFEAAPPEA